MRETLVEIESLKNLALKNIPAGWTVQTIRQLADTYAGGTPSRNANGMFAGLIPWVKSAELNQKEISDTEEKLTDLGYLSSSAKWVPANVPLIAMYGATAGVVSWLKIRAVTNQAVLAVIPNNEETDSRWLYWILFFYSSKLIASAQGSGQPNLNKNLIDQLQVLKAPINEQRQIAKILDTIDSTIAHTSSLIAKLKQMKAGLLHDLLTRGLDENGELRDAIAHPEQFKDSPLGQIPQEWKFCKFGDQVTLQRGFDITSKEMKPGNVPVIASSGLVGYHDTPMANPPGVITGRKGSLGEAFYVEEPYYPTDTTLWVKDFHGNYPKFIRRFIQWMRLERLDSATACPTLNRNFVHPIPVAFPPIDEQIQIEKVCDTYDNRICTEEVYRDKLKLQKQGLMHDLLTGKLRVKDADKFTSASDTV
jgi:type I restriction enzyme S subunit